ncbi:TPA: hypothetical protein ACJJY0_001336, partial [Enterobacter asburiae]
LRFSLRRGVCILRFPASESSDYFRYFLLTRRRVCRCSVSVEAHYRELFRRDKRKFKKSFHPRFFFTNRGEIELQIVLFDVSATTITFEVA